MELETDEWMKMLGCHFQDGGDAALGAERQMEVKRGEGKQQVGVYLHQSKREEGCEGPA